MVFKGNNEEARVTSMVSLLLTLNIFHILHNMKNAEICALKKKGK